MKKLIILIVSALILTGCLGNVKPELSAKMACYIEKYCTATEGSKLKAVSKAILQTQIRGSLPDLCKKHEQAWGYDQRAPLEQRCK